MYCVTSLRGDLWLGVHFAGVHIKSLSYFVGSVDRRLAYNHSNDCVPD